MCSGTRCVCRGRQLNYIHTTRVRCSHGDCLITPFQGTRVLRPCRSAFQFHAVKSHLNKENRNKIDKANGRQQAVHCLFLRPGDALLGFEKHHFMPMLFVCISLKLKSLPPARLPNSRRQLPSCSHQLPQCPYIWGIFTATNCRALL